MRGLHMSLWGALPEDLAARVLAEWLANAASLAALDVALCSHAERPGWGSLLRSFAAAFRAPLSAAPAVTRVSSFSTWLDRRGLNVSSLTIAAGCLDAALVIPTSPGLSGVARLTISVSESVKSLPESLVPQVLRLCPYADEFAIKSHSELLVNVAALCVNLRETALPLRALRLDRCVGVSDGDFAALGVRLVELQCLEVTHLVMPRDELLELAARCPHLRHLRISGLLLDGPALVQLLSDAPHLEELLVLGAPELFGVHLEAFVAKAAVHLATLSLFMLKEQPVAFGVLLARLRGLVLLRVGSCEFSSAAACLTVRGSHSEADMLELLSVVAAARRPVRVVVMGATLFSSAVLRAVADGFRDSLRSLLVLLDSRAELTVSDEDVQYFTERCPAAGLSAFQPHAPS